MAVHSKCWGRGEKNNGACFSLSFKMTKSGEVGYLQSMRCVLLLLVRGKQGLKFHQPSSGGSPGALGSRAGPPGCPRRCF